MKFNILQNYDNYEQNIIFFKKSTLQVSEIMV